MIPKKIFCIGLGGIGVSAIAKYYARQGSEVRGSDASSSPLIEDAVKHGVIFAGSDRDTSLLTKDIELVVHTDACPMDHPQLMAAKALGLPTQTFVVALSAIMEPNKTRIAISGTNGKSTTSALTALLLVDAGTDPSAFVGSRVTSFDGNLRIGSGTIFVAEADEWRNHFHALHPTILTINNIEHDHPDFFPDLASTVQSFQSMIDRLPAEGRLVLNIDDANVAKWKSDPRAITLSKNSEADLTYRIERHGPEYQVWSAIWRGQPIGPFRLNIPGEFNVANAACAVTTALAGGADPKTFVQTFEQFHGIWRRFEIIHPESPTVINDYAHHPTAVAATIQGAKEFYPGRRVIAAFQPHHHNRLTTLYQEFVDSFRDADVVIIDEVYAVLGRENTDGMKTSKDLVDDISKTGKEVYYAANATETLQVIKKQLQPNDVVLVMGAGDIWTIAKDIV